MSDSTNNPGDDAAEKALREGLRANGLSADALKRIRRVTEAEWRANTQAPPRRRWLPIAAAASVILVVGAALTAFVLNDAPASGALLGSVMRAEAPGLEQKRLLRRGLPMGLGADLRVGASLEARGDSLVTLAGGGNLRVARATTFEVQDWNAVRLEHGELYVDIPPGSRGSDHFLVITPAGEFRHIGTQFAVAIVNQQTRLRVREGSVLWQAADGESTVNAGTEVLIDRGKVTRRAIQTTGRDWTWAESLAPDIDIEDRPLQEFLEWFSRETGRKLVLADELARTQAGSIRMHGNVRGLTAMEALSAVMAATTLRYELPEGAIRVSSARDSSPTN